MPKTPTIALDGINVLRPLSAFRGGYLPPAAMAAARQYLGLFVIWPANLNAEQIGFGWVGRADAPTTNDGLMAAYNESQKSGQPLPVSAQHCNNSIYPTPEINLALRFWHDTHHVLRGRSFSIVDEIDTALWHLDIAEHDGIVHQSVAWHLLEADMLGQTLCASALGRFPLDQYQFDLSCLTFGIPDGIVLEAEHDQPRAEQLAVDSGTETDLLGSDVAQ